jgi:hypothetical protein
LPAGITRVQEDRTCGPTMCTFRKSSFSVSSRACPRRVTRCSRLVPLGSTYCCSTPIGDVGFSSSTPLCVFSSRVALLRPAFIGDRQIDRPEPHRQRRLRVVKDRPGGQRDLVPTRRTLPPPEFVHAIGASVLAARTHESVRPSTRGQVVLIGFLSGKLSLKIAHILRKGRSWHAATLHMVAC